MRRKKFRRKFIKRMKLRLLSKLLLFIGVLSFQFSFSQIVEPNSLRYDSVSVSEFEGTNGQLKIGKTYYRGGKRVLRKTFYSNGSISAQFSYKDGLTDGKACMWDSTGFLYEVSNFKKGVLHGKFLSWYPSGNIKSEGNYIKGKGTIKKYYETGELWTVEKHDNLRLVEISRYCKNGSLITTAKILPEYISKEYYCNGKLKTTGIVRNGLKEGSWKIYSESGDLITEEYYKEGQLTR